MLTIQTLNAVRNNDLRAPGFTYNAPRAKVMDTRTLFFLDNGSFHTLVWGMERSTTSKRILMTPVASQKALLLMVEDGIQNSH